MIYIITNDTTKFPLNPIYRHSKQEDLIRYIESQEELHLDAETRGFDPHTKALLSLQIGDEMNQFVIDCDSVDIMFLKPYLEAKLIVGQNLKFDLLFLYIKGIYPRKIYDTFVVEKVISCGLDYVRAGLDSLAERYCGVHLDKSIRINIPKEGLTPRVISYAAADIKHLPEIKRKQIEALKAQDLLLTANLENRFTPCLAAIELSGFKLDADKWRAKMKKDLANMTSLEEQLNNWIVAQDLQEYIDQQLDMFSTQQILINWGSPLQVSKFFESLGLDCSVQVKGVVKKSVEAPVIEKYAKEHEIVRLYLNYKKAEKIVTTYGEGFLQQINPVTNRLHTRFKQVLDTGRTSSGGKDSDKKTSLINFQNVPADPETRSCFIASEGNVLVGADFIGEEAVMLANYSLDAGLLKFYDEGLGDTHSYVASLMFPELQGLSLEEIKTKHKDKRQAAKSVGFAVAYGGNGSTIAENMGVTKEEGDKIYDAYFEGFPGLKEYFDKVKRDSLDLGYILISPITKRKSYLSFYDKYHELSKVMTKQFWTKYRKLKEEGGSEFIDAKKLVKEYFYFKGEIEKKSLNFPIQGSSAEVLKIALIYLHDYILDNNLFDVVRIANIIHDEIVLDCRKDLAEKMRKVLMKYMVKAGEFYCKRVPLKVTCEITDYWKK